MDMKKKTSDLEVKNFQYALKLAGITTSDSTATHAYKLALEIKEKGEEFNLRDSARIEAEVEAEFPDKKEKEEVVEEEA